MNAQFGEDKHILDFFGSRVASFLDIGAWDGIAASNTRALAMLGWNGVLVEPCPTAFNNLLANVKGMVGMVCVNAAVSETRELRKFHLQDDWGGTLNDEILKENLRKTLADYYVLTVSPSDLWEIGRKEGMNFEFVSIDAEWMDYEVLKGCRGLMDKTELLCVEVWQHKSAPDDPIPTICRELGFSRRIIETEANIIVARQT